VIEDAHLEPGAAGSFAVVEVFDYELPWNPNRLEQRIGRIHRYGQRYDAQIYNFMIEGSKEAQIFTVLQNKIETIRRQLGNMAEVLGILDRISLDDLILRVLKKSVDSGAVDVMAEQELRKMDDMAEAIQKTQFLSGCRQFTSLDIAEAEVSVKEAQKAIPTHKDVRVFVEAFLRVYGETGSGDRDGRKLQATKDKSVFRLMVPAVLQDGKLPRIYSRVTFERSVATADWKRNEEPEFLAFGHPLLERMVQYCRVTKAAELGGQLACLVADYAGGPGVVFNFVLKFEDLEGRVIREELEPVFVDHCGQVKPELGRKIFLAPQVPHAEPNRKFLAELGEKIDDLRRVAEAHIRHHYLDYYTRVERQRLGEIALLLDDLERFDKGASEQFHEKQRELRLEQQALFDDPSTKGLRTRLENQIKSHQHNMTVRRQQLDQMRLGAFPALAPILFI
jgi:hypothetical protein